MSTCFRTANPREQNVAQKQPREANPRQRKNPEQGFLKRIRRVVQDANNSDLIKRGNAAVARVFERQFRDLSIKAKRSAEAHAWSKSKTRICAGRMPAFFFESP